MTLFEAEPGDAELEVFAAVAPEVKFKIGADEFVLVFSSEAIVAFEREERYAILDGITHLSAVLAKEVTPQLTLIASMILAGMQRHHPRVTHGWCLTNALRPHVLRALFTALLKAMPAAQDPGDEQHFVGDTDPIPPAGVKRKSGKDASGTGRRSSKAGSRRAKG
jgi:hypothetical protein